MLVKLLYGKLMHRRGRAKQTLASRRAAVMAYLAGLTSAELAHLMGSLGVTLSRRQLEAAFCELDQNADGIISEREFLEWSQGEHVSLTVEASLGVEEGGAAAAQGGGAAAKAATSAAAAGQQPLLDAVG